MVLNCIYVKETLFSDKIYIIFVDSFTLEKHHQILFKQVSAKKLLGVAHV